MVFLANKAKLRCFFRHLINYRNKWEELAMSELVVKTPIAEGEMGNKRLSLGRIALLAAAVAGLIFIGRSLGGYLPTFVVWVNGLGVWGTVVFIAGYIVAAVAFVPGSVLTLAAGAICGLTRGVVIVFIAAVLGSAAAFLVSRYVARGAIERRLAGNPRFAAIDRVVGTQGRK